MKKKQLDNEMDVYAATTSPVVPRRPSVSQSEGSNAAADDTESSAAKTAVADTKETPPVTTVVVPTNPHPTDSKPAANGSSKVVSTSKANKKQELERLQARLVELETQAAMRKVQEELKPPAANEDLPANKAMTTPRVGGIDLRPKKIHASGFEPEDKEAVLTHFYGLGNVINFEWDGMTPSMTVEYSTRRHAEKAMSEGRVLGDRLLTFTWINEPRTVVQGPPIPSTQKYSEIQYKPSEKTEDSEDEDDGEVIQKTAGPETKQNDLKENATNANESSTKQKEDVDVLDPEAILYDGDDIVEIEEKDDERSWRR